MGIEQLRKVKGLQKPQQQNFKQFDLQRLKDRVKTRQAFQSEAARLDALILNRNLLGSISKYQNQFKTIPAEIRKFMKLNLNSATNELQSRINATIKLAANAKDKELRADNKNDKPNKKKFRAERRGYLEGLARLKKGEFLSIDAIDNYADSLGDAARSKEKARAKSKSISRPSKSILIKDTIKLGGRVIVGFTDKVTGKFTPSGKEDNMKFFDKVKVAFGTERKSDIIEISKKPLVKKQLDIMKSDISKFNQEITKQRIQLARDKKISISKYNKSLNRAIGGYGLKFLPKTFSVKDKESIYLKLSTTTTKSQAELNSKLKQISINKHLTALQKEDKRRRLIGLSPGYLKWTTIKQLTNPTTQELKEMINVITPKNIKQDSPFNVVSKNKKFNRWMEKQRQAAISKDENAKAALIGIASLPTNFLESFGDVIIGLASVFLNPIDTAVSISQLTKKDIDRAAANTGERIVAGKPGVVTDIITEFVTMKYGTGVLKNFKIIRKLNPKFAKIINGELILRKIPTEVFKVRGATRLLKARVKKPSFKRPLSSIADFLKGRKPGQFKRFTKDPGLILKTQTVQTGGRSLSAQAELAGQEITAVNAAAEQLTGWLKRKKLIRKPIPGEELFSVRMKLLLKKFDSGQSLTPKEFAEINKLLQKKVAGNITLLERSLYADPESGFRVSRLGISKSRTATLRDIVKGNFKLISSKPQVLIFENAKVAKFPTKLKDVEIKLRAGQKLTTKETNRLIKWQVETGSGKFKPIGSTIFKGGTELEVTLAPGEYIKRIKRVGFTFINDVKINFVTAEIWAPTKSIMEKIKAAKLGKLTNKQLLKLENDLSKKLGRKIKVETPKSKNYKLRKFRSDVPVLRIDGKYIRVTMRRAIPRKSATRKAPTRRATSRKPTTRKPTTRRPTARKPAARKPDTRKPAVRTPTARKPTVRKPTVRKPAVRKPTTRKPTTRKPEARPLSVRKPTVRAPRAVGRSKKPIIRLPNIGDKLPRGSRLTFNIRVAGKLFKIKKPINEALKRATIIVLRDRKLKKFDAVVAGTTRKKDILRPKAITKFKGTVGNKVYSYIKK